MSSATAQLFRSVVQVCFSGGLVLHMLNVRMSHVTCMRESCHMYE